MTNDITPKTIRELRDNRDLLLEKDCDYLSSFLEREWDKLRSVDQKIIIEAMIKDKHCNKEQIMPFLYKLYKDKDPSYRHYAISCISDLDGYNNKKFLIEVIKKDRDETNRSWALIELATTFSGQKDREILQLSLSMYDSPTSTTDARLSAGAAMMFQLNIPWDKDGRPAFWDDEEELSHPAIQKAVEETKKLLEATKP